MKGSIKFEEDYVAIKHGKRTIKFFKINEDCVQVQIHEGDNKNPREETVHSFMMGKTASLCVKTFFESGPGNII